MKIARHTDSELVIEDSLIWLAIVFCLATLPLLYSAIILGKTKYFIPAGLVLLFALICLRKTTCTFDSARRTVFVQTRAPFKLSRSSVPFEKIEDVVLDANTLGQQRPQYRLALVTPDGPIPLAGSYGSGRARYEAARQTILEFLTRGSHPSEQNARPAVSTSAPSALSELDPSVINLLRQGRKIDAITLFRTTHNVSLTEAKRRVDEIAALQKPEN